MVLGSAHSLGVMPFGAAVSQHPVTAHAVGEVAGQVLEAVGPGPDLAVLTVTAGHAGALEDAAAAIRSVLAPGVLLGSAAIAVVGGSQEIEDGPGVALWAGHTGPATPLRLERLDQPGQPDLLDRPDLAGGIADASAVVLLADPFSFDAEGLFARSPWATVPVLGGMASAAHGPGGNRLVLDGAVHTSGAVGAVLRGPVAVESRVSQGCRPVGQPLTVTRAERSIVYELAGLPAMQRLLEVAESELGPEEISLINQGGLHLGLVIDEHRTRFGPGDFLVRNVVGADRDNGAIQVAAEVPVGSTVQYHLRDATAASADLRAVLAGAGAAGALMFTCNGRGRRLFGILNHDASTLADVLGPVPVAGMFCAGEFGPVGGRNFLHGFTASVALFASPG